MTEETLLPLDWYCADEAVPIRDLKKILREVMGSIWRLLRSRRRQAEFSNSLKIPPQLQLPGHRIMIRHDHKGHAMTSDE